MAGRKLASAVYIDGKWYRAGDTLSEDVAAKVRNPKVFAPEDGDQTDQPRSEPGTPTGARLATRVQVEGKWYGPNDAVPDDVAARITNPKAWAGGELPTTAPAGSSATSEGGDDGTPKSPAADRLEPVTSSTASTDGSVDGEGDDVVLKARARRGRT